MISIVELRKKMQEARKSGDHELLKNVSILIGELDRKLDNTDEQIMATIKKLKDLELEFLKFSNKDTSSFLEFIDSLLPKQVSQEEIVEWINANVDFTKLKNKMQSVGMVMKHFGQSASGDFVKKLITENYQYLK